MKKNSTTKRNNKRNNDNYELKPKYDLSKMTVLPKGRFDPKRCIAVAILNLYCSHTQPIVNL
jgi:hypothetical protein